LGTIEGMGTGGKKEGSKRRMLTGGGKRIQSEIEKNSWKGETIRGRKKRTQNAR